MACCRALAPSKVLLCRNLQRLGCHRPCSVQITHLLQHQLFPPALYKLTRGLSQTSHPGLIKKWMKKVGWLDYSKARLKRSAYYLYEGVPDNIDYAKFFKEFEMEDTFFSWFLITELHVWMLCVRVMAEREEGRFVRNNIVEAMWKDSEARAKLLGEISSRQIKTEFQGLFEQFQAALVNYDEGLLSDDKVLAAAVWGIFFNKKCNDPEKVECLVRYIRKQIKLLDELSREKLLLSCDVHWLTLEPIRNINV